MTFNAVVSPLPFPLYPDNTTDSLQTTTGRSKDQRSLNSAFTVITTHGNIERNVNNSN
jgi:hypothetical protein